MALALCACAPGQAAAQGWREAQLWAVATASEPAAYAGGLGLAWRDRGRTRVGLALAAGVTDDSRPAGRAEFSYHFLLDPTRTRGPAIYAGGGVALTAVEGSRLKPWVLLTAGAELSPAGPRGLFVEAGVGGGARAALGLRFRKRNAPGR